MNILYTGAFKLFLSRIRFQSGLFALGLICMVLATLGGLAGPWLFAIVIDRLLLPEIVDQRLKWIAGAALAYLMIETTRVAFSICQEYVFTQLGQRFMHDLRRDLFGRMLRLPMRLFDQTPVGRLTTRVTNDISALGDVFTSGFVMVFGNILMILAIMGQMLTLNLKLGLMAIMLVPLVLWASVTFTKMLAKNYREARLKLSAFNAALSENIQGIKTTHLFNRQTQQQALLSKASQELRTAQRSSLMVFAHFIPVINLVAGATMALVIWHGANDAWRGAITLGTLSAFFAYVVAMFHPLLSVAEKWNVFLSALAALEGIHQLMQEPTETKKPVTEPHPGSALVLHQPNQGQIRFENVWFRYRDDAPWVLKGLTFEIQASSRVALVGPTGSGKTSIASLLMRFYAPQQGRILLDGMDIQTMPLDQLRQSLGYLAQEAFLFETLGENNRVSQGEKQVVAFGRMQKRKPSVWILDEATANLDGASEAAQLEAIWQVPHTVILIAHRFSTLTHADHIIVLSHGEIQEQGTHSTLIEKQGLFQKMALAQSLGAL